MPWFFRIPFELGAWKQFKKVNWRQWYHLWLKSHSFITMHFKMPSFILTTQFHYNNPYTWLWYPQWRTLKKQPIHDIPLEIKHENHYSNPWSSIFESHLKRCLFHIQHSKKADAIANSLERHPIPCWSCKHKLLLIPNPKTLTSIFSIIQITMKNSNTMTITFQTICIPTL